MLLPCPLCSTQLWHTESGLANHVWHDHSESKICMAHGNASVIHGDPAAACCSRSVKAVCALRLARTKSHTPRLPEWRSAAPGSIEGTFSGII
jgi:hypothetical protein